MVFSTLTGASVTAAAVTGVGTSPIPPGARSFFRPPELVGMGGLFLGGTVLLKTLLFSLLSSPGGLEFDDDDVAVVEVASRDVEVEVEVVEAGVGLGVAVGARRGVRGVGVAVEGTESNPLTA
jgi:hypothetical protein